MRQPKEYHYSRWSDKDLQTLRQMLREGRHTTEIASALGRTYWAVANVIYRLKVRDKK